MTEAWPKPYTFRALRKTFGAMWVHCDVCRRYAPLSIGGLQEVDYRSKTFSCSQCGSEGYLAVIDPMPHAGLSLGRNRAARAQSHGGRSAHEWTP